MISPQANSLRLGAGCVVIIGLAFFGTLAASLSGAFWASLQDGRSNVNWSVTDRKVVLSRVRDLDDDGPVADIEYVYKVDAAKYFSSNVNCLFQVLGAREFVKRYPQGANVCVS